jgi:hypothetical protein
VSETAIAQLFDRLRRHVLATEAENARLRDARALAEQRITDLRDENERLKRELAAERASRAELVDQVIDWMGQGEEIVRAGVAKTGPVPAAAADSLAPGQTARAALREDLAELTRPRERFGQAEFDRTFGSADAPA